MILLYGIRSDLPVPLVYLLPGETKTGVQDMDGEAQGDNMMYSSTSDPECLSMWSIVFLPMVVMRQMGKFTIRYWSG